jgi:hypothetical protein
VFFNFLGHSGGNARTSSSRANAPGVFIFSHRGGNQKFPDVFLIFGGRVFEVTNSFHIRAEIPFFCRSPWRQGLRGT